MPPTITQGMKGRLEFQPAQAGLDPATITDIKWTPQGPQTHVKFTQPDQVEGISPGTGQFTCAVTCGPGESMTWKFAVECLPLTPPGPPATVPVVVFTLAPTPPTPAAPPPSPGA
jgi:hypothetical protein